MIHNKIQDQLEAYHDGQLTEPDRHEVETHVGTCVSCTETLGRLKAASQAVFRSIPVPSTDFFVTRVMAGIRHSQQEDSSGVFQNLWQWTAFSLVALAAFFLISAPAESPRPPSRSISTGNVLLAGDNANLVSAERLTEPMDSLLDLTEEI